MNLKEKIRYALEWYANTDGSEREQASDYMFELLSEIYNNLIMNNEVKPHKTRKRK